MKKRISIIGIVGVPAKYGGFETFADYMSCYIDDKYELTVYCSAKSYEEQIDIYEKAKLKYIPLKATGAQSIPYDIWSIFVALNKSDVLLVLGSSGAIILPFVKFFTKKKIVFNMAGLEWKRTKWNKYARWFLKFSEKIAVKYSDEVVVDNKGLQEYITAEYDVNSNVIAYGGDQVTKMAMTEELMQKFDFLRHPYYAAVARIQHDNNIDMILEAFEKIPEKNIVFVGNWDSSDYGKALKVKYAGIEHIHLLDPIYDLQILDQIRSNCIAYVHGHSSGGTNPSLVEAMHLDIPIIAYDVNFNHYTTQDQSLYFSDSLDLIDRINNMDMDKEKKQAHIMKNIANEIYTWNYIIKEYEKLFYIKGKF